MNKFMQNKKIIHLVLIGISLLFFYSCKGEGIFYNLRDEVLIANSSFDDEADIRSLFILSGDIYAVGTSLWVKESGASGWDQLHLPNSIDKGIGALTSAVSYNNNIYASFYQNGASSIFYYDTGSSTWSVAATALPASDDNYILFSDPDDPNNLYINQVGYGSSSNEQTNLYLVNTPTFSLAASTPLVTLNHPVVSMTYDSRNTNYWLVANSSYESENFDTGVVYRSDNWSTPVIGFESGAYNEIQAIPLDGSNTLLLLGFVNGNIQYGLNDFSDSANLSSGNSSDMLESFLSLPTTDISTATVLGGIANLSSFASQGYITLSYTYNSTGNTVTMTKTANIADDNNYNSSTLISSHIYSMVSTGTPSLYQVYAATGNGIWRFDSNTQEWALE